MDHHICSVELDGQSVKNSLFMEISSFKDPGPIQENGLDSKGFGSGSMETTTIYSTTASLKKIAEMPIIVYYSTVIVFSNYIYGKPKKYLFSRNLFKIRYI